MKEKTLLSEQYQSLLTDLRRIQETTRTALGRAVNPIVLEGYWQMGRRLSSDSLLGAESRKSVIGHLAHDLEIENSTLSRIIKFYRLWPDSPPSAAYPNVSWSHFKIIMSVRDENARQFYLAETNAGGWYVRRLKENVSTGLYQRRLEIASEVTPQEGSIKKQKKVLLRKPERLHLYSAMLEKVVDGDTLVLFIDLGFNTWRSERIRLRGIDTPERKTPEGQAAKKFVEEKLRGNRHLVVQTFKVDIYGRYVADIFYLLGEGNREQIAREGHFLNQEILDAGHAEIME